MRFTGIGPLQMPADSGRSKGQDDAGDAALEGRIRPRCGGCERAVGRPIFCFCFLFYNHVALFFSFCINGAQFTPTASLRACSEGELSITVLAQGGLRGAHERILSSSPIQGQEKKAHHSITRSDV